MRVKAAVLVVMFAAAAAGMARAEYPLCARGAVAGPVPVGHLLQQDGQALRVVAFESVDWKAVSEAEDRVQVAPEAPKLRDLLAERSAALPPAARDLPYLVVLAEVEASPDGAIFTLTQGAESLIAARLLDAMDRAGLTQEAALLREAVGLFPDWGDTPEDRAEQVYDRESYAPIEPLSSRLAEIDARWPAAGGRALAAAEALVAADPALSKAYADRLNGLTEDERFGWLQAQLWAQCTTPSWWTVEEADAAFLSGGTVQGALLMLDLFAGTMEEGGGLADFFYNSPGTFAPRLATILDLRNQTAAAKALRDGMALFGGSYPRDYEQRMMAMDAFTEAQFAQLDDLSLAIDVAEIRRDMQGLAREAGLLPPRGN